MEKLAFFVLELGDQEYAKELDWGCELGDVFCFGDLGQVGGQELDVGLLGLGCCRGG